MFRARRAIIDEMIFVAFFGWRLDALVCEIVVCEVTQQVVHG